MNKAYILTKFGSRDAKIIKKYKTQYEYYRRKEKEMNKFVMLSLAYVALLAGCSLNNRFFARGTKSESACGFIFHDSIPHDKLYVPRNLEDFLDIYSRSKSQKSGEYEYKLVETLSHYYNGTSTMVPIESCDDKWCKIYYPCDDTEYYVKKDKIQRLYDLMYPNKR